METFAVKEKKIKKFSILLLVFAAVFIIGFPSAQAKISWKRFPFDMTKQILSGPSSVIFKILLPSDSGVDKDGGEKYYYDYVTGSGMDSIDEDFKGFYDVALIIGFAIAIGYAAVHLFQNMERGQDPVEEVFKFLMELFIVAFFMMMLSDIINWVADLGGTIIKEFISSNSTTAMIASSDSSDLDERSVQFLANLGFKVKAPNYHLGFLNWLRAMAMLFLPWVGSFLLIIAAYFVGFSILIELGLRRLFFPIAVADIYGEGVRSMGMRYIKKYLAAFLKIVICIAVAVITIKFEELGGEALKDDSGIFAAFSYIAEVIAVNLTSIGMMLKGGELANDVAGA